MLNTAVAVEKILIRWSIRSAYRIQDWTGISSYRLTQAAVVGWILPDLVEVVSYFGPSAAARAQLIDVLLFPLFAYWATVTWRHCDSSQARWLDGHTAMQLPPMSLLFTGTLIYRIFMLWITLSQVGAWLILTFQDGFSWFVAFRYSYSVAWFYYLFILWVPPKPYEPRRVLVPVRSAA